MKIGEFVRLCVPNILASCEGSDPSEFERLQDKKYSRKKFGIYHAFLLPSMLVSTSITPRYWQVEHSVRGAQVRVCSQWVEKNREKFLHYLNDRGILTASDAPNEVQAKITQNQHARYRGNAIGNAQNLFVRNILSRLGNEEFNKADWLSVIDSFGGRCAYCDGDGKLVIDHVVPINRTALGEHRLGNLVPSCAKCNQSKQEQDFRDFLVNDPKRIAAIEAHMARHNYHPIEDSRINVIIDLAHAEVRLLANRYVAIIAALSEKSGQ